jgi:thiol-disulfide isomerase/thioredoxin
MKQTLLIFTSFLILSSCNLNENKKLESQSGKFYPEVEQRSVIIGQITNINDFIGASRKIELAVDDITIDQQHLFETTIDDSGKFVFDIPLYHSTNTYLNYGDGRITPYLFPNDTLYLECNIDRKNFRIGIESGKFDEKHEKFQNQFFKQSHWIHYKQINPFRNNLSQDLAPQELKHKYLTFEKLLLKRIENRVKRDSLNGLLEDYLINSAKYSIYQSIISLGKQIMDYEERHKFYSFITDSVAFNKNAMVSSDYQHFLNWYRFDVEQGKSWRVDTVGKTREAIIHEAINMKLYTAMSIREGLWGEILAANIINNETRMREEVLDEYIVQIYYDYATSNFKDQYIRQISQSLCKSSNEKIKEILSLTIPKEAKLFKNDSMSGEDLFDNILTENKGKVIFIDIWGTWCAPCKQEIPDAIRVHEIFKDKNVSFVYLCCRSKDEPWEKVIKQYQIGGNHYLLNAEQYAFIENKFSISGIPHFLLINKYGDVANGDAPRPSNDKLLSDIDSLINE